MSISNVGATMMARPVPSWVEVMDAVVQPVHHYGSPLLARYPRVVEEERLTVFFGESRYIVAPIGRYLAERVALREADLTKKAVLVFSFNETPQDYLRRMACGIAGLDVMRIEEGRLTPEERAACGARYEAARAELEAADIHVVDALGLTVEDMEEEIGGLPRPMDCGLVVIDGLLDCTCRSCAGGELGWGMVANRLSCLARRWQVAVVVLATASEDHLLYPYKLFDGYGVFRDYVDQGFTVRWRDRLENDPERLVRRYQFDLVVGPGNIDPFGMDLDLSSGRFCDDS